MAEIVDPFDSGTKPAPSPRSRQRDLQMRATEEDIKTAPLRRAQIGADLAQAPTDKARAQVALGVDTRTADAQVAKALAEAEKAKVEAATATARSASPVGNATQDERQTAMMLSRLSDSQRRIRETLKKNPDAIHPNLVAETVKGLPLVGSPLANVANSPERRRVVANQLDMLDAALWLSTGAAYNKEQLRTMYEAYFPQPFDDPETIKDKRGKLTNLLDGARIRAGMAAGAVKEAPAGKEEATGLPAGFKFLGPVKRR